MLRSPLRRIDACSAGAKPPNAKTPSAGKTPSRLRRTESASKTPAAAGGDSPGAADWDDIDVSVVTVNPPRELEVSGDAEMESEIGAVVALAAMSGGKEAPAIAMSGGGADARPAKPETVGFRARRDAVSRARAGSDDPARAPTAVLLRV